MEDILKLLDDHYVLKLDDRGNVEEIIRFYREDIIHEPFIILVSDEDKKRAAKLFLDALEKGYAERVIRLKKEEEYGIFNLKMLVEGGEILFVAREMGREKPSFVADLLGNVIDAHGRWESLINKNLFDVVEDDEKLLRAIREAVDRGVYEGSISINEKEMRLRIRAATHLEFFVEEDIYGILEKIMDAGNVREIFEEMKNALKIIADDFYVHLFNMEEGERKEGAIYHYPVMRRGEVVGGIDIYHEMDETSLTMLKTISFIASKATEKIKEVSNILNDFAIYKIDEKGNIVYVNPKFEKLTGFREKEVRGVNLREISERGNDFFREIAARGKVEDYISKWRSKKGEIIVRERAWRINGETLVAMEDVSRQVENEKEVEFYNSLLRHDIFNKNEIAMGYIGLMEKTNLTKKQKDFLEKIKEVIKEANELIEKVRKAETIRKAKSRTMPVNVGRVLKQVCGGWADKLKEKGIEIKYKVGNIMVEADDFLPEIFHNLVENSFEHAECKSIEISGERENGYYIIHYEDDGKGVEEKYLESIFDEGWKRNSSGSGLGLYMVKKLMARYGGKVEAEKGEKGGLRINLYFRRAKRGKNQEILKMRL